MKGLEAIHYIKARSTIQPTNKEGGRQIGHSEASYISASIGDIMFK
jgi:hypothetical protein